MQTMPFFGVMPWKLQCFCWCHTRASRLLWFTSNHLQPKLVTTLRRQVVHVACGGGQQGCTGAVTLQGELFTFGVSNANKNTARKYSYLHGWCLMGAVLVLSVGHLKFQPLSMGPTFCLVFFVVSRFRCPILGTHQQVVILGRILPSLKLTANAPENRPKRTKRKRSSSNHPFSGDTQSMLVSGRVIYKSVDPRYSDTFSMVQLQ